MLRPKGAWYPNQKIENALSAKFSGSPQPKQFAGSGRLSNLGNDIVGAELCGSASKQGSFKINPTQIDCVSDFGAFKGQRPTKFQSTANMHSVKSQNLSNFQPTAKNNVVPNDLIDFNIGARSAAGHN